MVFQIEDDQEPGNFVVNGDEISVRIRKNAGILRDFEIVEMDKIVSLHSVNLQLEFQVEIDLDVRWDGRRFRQVVKVMDFDEVREGQ